MARVHGCEPAGVGRYGGPTAQIARTPKSKPAAPGGELAAAQRSYLHEPQAQDRDEARAEQAAGRGRDPSGAGVGRAAAQGRGPRLPGLRALAGRPGARRAAAARRLRLAGLRGAALPGASPQLRRGAAGARALPGARGRAGAAARADACRLRGARGGALARVAGAVGSGDEPTRTMEVDDEQDEHSSGGRRDWPTPKDGSRAPSAPRRWSASRAARAGRSR